METVKEAELGTTEKPITKDVYWFQYALAFSGKKYSKMTTIKCCIKLRGFQFFCLLSSLLACNAKI